MHVGLEDARHVAQQRLLEAGATDSAARLQVDLLLEADLRGHPSHGLARLPRLLRRIMRGLADARTHGHHHWRTTGVLSMDGARGLGPVIGTTVMRLLSDRARSTGIALGAISNTNHLGMLAWYVEPVAAAGQIAIASSTSEALVHPYGGSVALVGTNPIAIAAPATPEPVVVDLATGLVSMGKIHDHRDRGEPIPGDWALGPDGAKTTDPVIAAQGSIAPFGGAKGYALGLALEIVIGSLTDSALGTAVRGTLDDSEPCNKGDVFIVVDPPAAEQTSARIDAYLRAIRDCPPAESGPAVTVPGDRSRLRRAEQLDTGTIELTEQTWTQLSQSKT